LLAILYRFIVVAVVLRRAVERFNAAIQACSSCRQAGHDRVVHETDRSHVITTLRHRGTRLWNDLPKDRRDMPVFWQTSQNATVLCFMRLRRICDSDAMIFMRRL